MLDLPLALFIIVLGVVLSACGSLAEAAILSTNRLRVRSLKEGGKSRVQALEGLLARPRQVLSSLVFINTVSTVVAASVSVELVRELFGPSLGLWSVPLGILIIAMVVLVFGEILPKAVASQAPERTAIIISRPVEIVSWLLGPVVGTLEAITGVLLRPFGWRGDSLPPLISEEELQMLLQTKGLVEDDEREMISGIFELEDTTVREIMTPRIDIIAASVASSLDEVVQLIIDTGRSRIPVFEGTIDNVVGIVYAKDLLAAMAKGKTPSVATIARSNHMQIPENTRVDELLHDMQQMRVHMAIVIDEYGGTAGLVTIEDLIERIVGDIRDEYDLKESEEIVEVTPGEEWHVIGRTSLADLNEAIDLELDDPEVDTIGGYVAARLGRIPVVGDTVIVDNATIRVTATTGRRIRALRINRAT